MQFETLRVYVINAKELELELIQTQMTQKPMLRAEVCTRVRCAQVKIVKRIVCRGQEA